LIPRSVELTPRMPLKTISVRLAKPVRMRVAIFRETRSHDLKKKKNTCSLPVLPYVHTTTVHSFGRKTYIGNVCART
jgi:hypothetical protein